MLHLVMIGDTIISKHCIISLLNKLTQKAGQWQGYARGQHLYHMYSTTYSLNLNWVFYVLIQTNNWPIYHCKHIYKVLNVLYTFSAKKYAEYFQRNGDKRW